MMTKRLFLASSAELKGDREQFELFIGRKNKDWIARGVYLELVIWEDSLDAVSHTRLQDEYNKAIRECDVFVMLFWTKVGQYTEEEFETAFGQFQATNKPFIFTYFKDAEISTGSANKKDLMSLWAFQEKLSALGHFYTTYKNVDELKYKFNQQLDKLAASGFVEFDPSQADGPAPTNEATLTCSGAIAQGSGAVAVGRGGVFIGRDNAGTVNTGTQISGDLVRGDKVLGDKIGSQINTGGGAYFGGPVSAGGNIIGRDQITTQGVAARDLESLFAPLLALVAEQAPSDKRAAAVQQVQDLKAEVAKREQADDGKIATIVDGLVALVPKAVGAVVSTFAMPILSGIAGPATKFVLNRLQRK
jgi:hypothetical protein